MVVRHVNLHLLATDGLARLIALRELVGIKYAHHGLEVVVDGAGGLNDTGWRCLGLQASRHGRWLALNVLLLVTQNRRGLDVGLCPFVFVALVLALGQQPFGLWRQSNRLGQGGAPVVIHPLWVFGHANQTVLLALVVNGDLLAIDRHDGNVLAHPCGLFQHFQTGQLAPLDQLAHSVALRDDKDASSGHQFGAGGFVLEHLCAVRQQQQLGLHALGEPPLSDADVFLHDPVGISVTGAAVVEVAAIVSVGVLGAEVLFAHHLGDQAGLSVRSIRHLRVRVKVDRERVGDGLDVDFLVE